MRASSGSITKVAHNTWRVRVSLGYNPKTGKRIQKTKQIRGSRRDAELLKSQMLITEEPNKEPKKEPINLSELVEKYLNHIQDSIRKPTFQEYERLASKITNSTISVLKAEELYQYETEVRAWLNTFPAGRGRLSQYKILRQVLNYGKRQHLLTVSVCDFIPEPKVERGRIETINLEELPQYLEAVKDTEIEAGILLMAYMGLRRSEALARKWSDIQFFDSPQEGAGGVIRIDSSLRELKGGGIVFEPPKTKKSERTNYIPQACSDRLKQIKKSQRGKWVCEHNNLIMRPDFFSCTWRKTLKEHGLKHIQLKNLRHSCGTILIRELGASVADVAELLGHSTTATTETFYLQQSDTSKKRVAKMWQNL